MKKKIVKAEIVSNKKVAPDHFVLEVKSAYLGRHAVPGQFVNVKVGENTTDPLLRIPLGVHLIGEKRIKLLYKVVGVGTTILSSQKKGELIDILGPLGKGFDLAPLLKKKGSQAVIVSGGQGIAPLYALTEAIIKKKIEVDFFTGACSKKHLVCVKDLKKLGAKVHLATDDGTVGHKGYITGLLKKYLQRTTNESEAERSLPRGDEQRTTIYACGPKPMLSVVSKVARMFNIPAQVSLDEYMACGIGACLGCAVRTINGYKMVCKDGPVFDAEEICW